MTFNPLYSSTIARLRQAIHRNPLLENTKEWQKILEKIPTNQFKKIIEEVCRTEASIPALNRLAELLPLDKLQEAVQINGIDALKEAQSMFHEAEHYLATQTQYSPSIRTRIRKILDAISIFMETLIYGFGISELFKKSENSVDAQFKVHIFYTVSSLFAVLTTLLAPLVGTSFVAYIVGGTILTLAALSLIYPYISPAPTYFMEGQNWTKLLNENKLEVPEGRKKILNEIARTLLISQRVKTHPMLIGPSGVGKTETIKAFTQALEHGDFPALKGKQVIYFNTANITQHHDVFSKGNKILDRISEIMGRHRSNYILVFDEIQTALKRKDADIGEQLKTMLDPGNSNFPYVIGITTADDFYQKINVDHVAFARRFHPIYINDPDPQEMLSILNCTLLKHYPQTLIEPDALEYLLEQIKLHLPQSPKLVSSGRILTSCVQMTSPGQLSPREKQAEALRVEIDALLSRMTANYPHPDAALSDQIQSREKDLHSIEETIAKEKDQIEALCSNQDQFARVKKAVMEKITKVVKTKRTKEISAFLLLNYFKIPSLLENIRKESNRLGLSMVINRELIDIAIQEEKKWAVS